VLSNHHCEVVHSQGPASSSYTVKDKLNRIALLRDNPAYNIVVYFIQAGQYELLYSLFDFWSSISSPMESLGERYLRSLMASEAHKKVPPIIRR
jgi:hypothetical protein